LADDEASPQLLISELQRFFAAEVMRYALNQGAAEALV
jgi:hypothetical protein